MWRSQNFNASRIPKVMVALSSSVSAQNFSEMPYLCENPLFATYPCVTNPLFDEVLIHTSEGIIAQMRNDAPLDNGPHELSLLHSSPDGSLESCPVLTICNVLRKQDTSYPWDLIKDISEKPQSMEFIENPLFVSFPCVTNPLFDSQDAFEKGFVDDVVGALEALKMEAHEERIPYVTAQFPKAMADYMTDSELNGKELQGNQFIPYILEPLPIEREPPTRKNGQEDRAMLHNSMILIWDENFCFKSLRRFR